MDQHEFEIACRLYMDLRPLRLGPQDRIVYTALCNYLAEKFNKGAKEEAAWKEGAKQASAMGFTAPDLPPMPPPEGRMKYVQG